MSYLTEHELIAKFQSAYRRFHSTETAMFRVLNDILLTIDSRQEAVLVLLEMSSASSKVEACVKDILIWCTKKMLSCNPRKTKILQLLSRFSRTDSPPIPLLVGRDMIFPVPVARDLGITLDKHLTLH